ncbi:MAG TPA: hypothetical protein VGB04_13185 [Allosphingosinicella sp.]
MIAAVSRMDNTMDLFWVGPDGSVNNARWYDMGDRQWESGELLPPGSASVTGGIAAISRDRNAIEIFWIGPDGAVRQGRWSDDREQPGGLWDFSAFAPPGSASATSGIAAVSRRPDTKEVFWVAPDSSLRNAFLYDSTREWKFGRLAGNAALDSHVTAVSRNADNLDVVYSEAVIFDEVFKWIPIVVPNPNYFPTFDENGMLIQDPLNPEYLETGEFYGETKKVSRYHLVICRWSDDSKTSGLKGVWRTEPLYYTKTLSAAAAVCRNPDTIEIFYVEHGGALHHSFWYEGGARWQHSALTPPLEASPFGGVTATARKSGTIEVMWISLRGEVNNIYWYDGHPWKTYHQTDPDAASNEGDIALISRIPESLEAFWVGSSGKLTNGYWYE